MLEGSYRCDSLVKAKTRPVNLINYNYSTFRVFFLEGRYFGSRDDKSIPLRGVKKLSFFTPRNLVTGLLCCVATCGVAHRR